MLTNQSPPPPQTAPVPAHIQTISAAQAQQLLSPGQSVINAVNSGQYGKGFTANMQNAATAVQDAGKIAKDIGDARDRRNKNRENNSPSRKGPGYTQRPPDKSSGNKAIADYKAKTANSQMPAIKNAPQANSSTNKAIANLQNPAAGQSASASDSRSTGASKGGQSR